MPMRSASPERGRAVALILGGEELPAGQGDDGRGDASASSASRAIIASETSEPVAMRVARRGPDASAST
jgi:hypothetical protein